MRTYFSMQILFFLCVYPHVLTNANSNLQAVMTPNSKTNVIQDGWHLSGTRDLVLICWNTAFWRHVVEAVAISLKGDLLPLRGQPLILDHNRSWLEISRNGQVDHNLPTTISSNSYISWSQMTAQHTLFLTHGFGIADNKLPKWSQTFWGITWGTISSPLFATNT